MPPPQLPADAPVADVAQPGVVGVLPLLWHEAGGAVLHGGEGGPGQGLHVDEPLGREHGLDDGLAALGDRQLHRVRLRAPPESTSFKLFFHAIPCDEPVQPLEGTGLAIQRTVQVHDVDHRKVVTLADLEVVEVMRGGDLHAARAELGVDEDGVRDNRDLAVHEGMLDRLADEVGVARVLGMHGHRRVAQHGLGAGGRHHDLGDLGTIGAGHGTLGQGVGEAVQLALVVLVLDLEVGQGRPVVRIPVDEALATVDEPLLIQADEVLLDGILKSRIEGEAIPRPVARHAEAVHLLPDAAARRGLSHSHTFSTKASRPRSRKKMPWASSCLRTTHWVAMPAWSVPGNQRTL